MPAKTVTLELPFGVHLKAFHCPFCGAVLMDHQQFADNPCPHLLFAYIEEVGDFQYVTERLQESAEAALEKGNPVKALAKACSDTAIVFGLTTGGMGCGPTWETIWFGVDACPKVRRQKVRKAKGKTKTLKEKRRR